MANITDTLIEQVPEHIIENYPEFFQFIEDYYTWVCQEGNPYNHIKHHMDYMNFVESLESYTSKIKNEVLVSMPENVFGDKEQLIKWSKKFNSSRGSHESFKFLFKVLFNEQDTSIYVPKKNIFSLSSGKWISGESVLLVTHSLTNVDDFQFKQIKQTREVYPGFFEYATANVERIRTKYSGKFVVTELTVSSVKGEFKENYPIETVDGVSEWLIKTIDSVNIENGGTGFQSNERINLIGADEYTVSRPSEFVDVFDSRLTTLYQTSEITVKRNDVALAGFVFDGRYVYHDDIAVDDVIEVIVPSYQGYILVDAVQRETGKIQTINIVDAPITTGDTFDTSVDGLGIDSVLTAVVGYVKPVKGYYEDTKGFLSNNQYLQDSFFYQKFSYAIKTEQDYLKYADIVKRLIHPAGFLMFGQINLIQLIETILTYKNDMTVTPRATEKYLVSMPKYGLGNSYETVTRIRNNVHYNKDTYTQEFLDELDQNLLDGEINYDLEDIRQSTIDSYEYPARTGWMAQSNFIDCQNYILHDYSDDPDSGSHYFDNGFVSTRTELPDNVILTGANSSVNIDHSDYDSIDSTVFFHDYKGANVSKQILGENLSLIDFKFSNKLFISLSDAVSPDGINLSKIARVNSFVGDAIIYKENVSFVSGNTYTTTLFVKNYDNNTKVDLILPDDILSSEGSPIVATFDPVTGNFTVDPDNGTTIKTGVSEYDGFYVPFLTVIADTNATVDHVLFSLDVIDEYNQGVIFYAPCLFIGEYALPVIGQKYSSSNFLIYECDALPLGYQINKLTGEISREYSILRSGEAYYQDADLVLRKVPNNTVRPNFIEGEYVGNLIEDSVSNLLSGDVDSFDETRCSVTSEMALGADDEMSLFRIKEDNTSSNTHFITTNVNLKTITNDNFVFGVFVKGNGRNLRIAMTDAFDGYIQVDLSDNSITESPEVVKSGVVIYANDVRMLWLNVKVNNLSDSVTCSIYVTDDDNVTYNGDNESGLFLGKPFLYKSEAVSSYIDAGKTRFPDYISRYAHENASVSTYVDAGAVLRTSPIDHTRPNFVISEHKDTPVSGRILNGVLVESEATQLINDPIDISGVNWDLEGITVSTDVNEINVTDTISAKFIKEDSSDGLHTISQTFSVDNGKYLFVSAIVKAKGRDKFGIEILTNGIDVQSQGTIGIDGSFFETGNIVNSGHSELFNDYIYVWGTVLVPEHAYDVTCELYLMDGSGFVSYIGDNVSGVYVYGFNAVSIDNIFDTFNFIPYFGTKSADVVSPIEFDQILNKTEDFSYGESFARNSTRLYENASRVLVSVAIDVIAPKYVNGVYKGHSVEPKVSQLIETTAISNFNNWTNSIISPLIIISNNVVSPDGTANGSEIYGSGGTLDYMHYEFEPDINIGRYKFSMYAKPINTNYISVRFFDLATAQFDTVVIDLSDGSTFSLDSVNYNLNIRFEAKYNGWKRFHIDFDVHSDGFDIEVYSGIYNVNTSGRLYVYGSNITDNLEIVEHIPYYGTKEADDFYD